MRVAGIMSSVLMEFDERMAYSRMPARRSRSAKGTSSSTLWPTKSAGVRARNARFANRQFRSRSTSSSQSGTLSVTERRIDSDFCNASSAFLRAVMS